MSTEDRQPVTLPRIAEMKRAGEPIVMITAYDYPSAQIVDEAGVDMVLVGDSAAMVVLGYDATTPVGMDEMLMMTSAVRRGLERPLLIGASSRKRVATPSSSSAAAPLSTAQGRSFAPASR